MNILRGIHRSNMPNKCFNIHVPVETFAMTDQASLCPPGISEGP